MNQKIYLASYCSRAAMDEAARLHEEERLSHYQEETLEDGSQVLNGKITDSFHFVDHPRVVLHAGAITALRCDCPEYRKQRIFCPHCAVLVMEYGITDVPPQPEQPAPSETDSTTAAETDSTTAAVVDSTTAVAVDSTTAAAVDSTTAAAVDSTTAAPAETPCLKDFSYAFCNSRSDLYPGIAAPRIPLARYKQVFGNTIRARQIYQMAGSWGGSCFGMVASSTMLYCEDCDIDIKNFSASAKCPSELKLSDFHTTLGMSLHTFVEAVHITQYSNRIGAPRMTNIRNPKCMATLCARVKAFQEGKGAPVGMAVWENEFWDGGHSVFPYHIESLSPTEDRLHIYDPNHPLEVRYAYFEKDAQGNYVNWRFPMFDQCTYSGDTGGILSFDDYVIYKKTWDSRGSAAICNMMTLHKGMSVSDISGFPLVHFTQQGLVSQTDDIYPLAVTGCSVGNAIHIPAGSYLVRNENPDLRLDTQMTGNDLSVSIRSEASEAVITAMDDGEVLYAAISEADKVFCVEFLSMEDGQEKQVRIEGVTTAEGIRLAQEKGVLYASNPEGLSLTINDEQIPQSLIGRYFNPLIHQETEEEDMVLTNIPSEDGEDGDSDAPAEAPFVDPFYDPAE